MEQLIISKDLVIKSVLVIFYGSTLWFIHSRYFKFLVNRSSIFLTLMLPISILSITQAIATNLYLSLGLVGALSIVRYRTPVKSQYELAYLFSLIAIGVIGGVNYYFAGFLTLILCLFPIVLFYFFSKFPFFLNDDLRVNGDRRVEVTIVVNINDLTITKDHIQKSKGHLVRFDMNNSSENCIFLVNFDTLSEFDNFHNLLGKEIAVNSISVMNV
jgi:hypothetical protein